MRRKSEYYPPFKDEGELIASWGEARLIKFLDGKVVLKGGRFTDCSGECGSRPKKSDPLPSRFSQPGGAALWLRYFYNFTVRCNQVHALERTSQPGETLAQSRLHLYRVATTPISRPKPNAIPMA